MFHVLRTRILWRRLVGEQNRTKAKTRTYKILASQSCNSDGRFNTSKVCIMFKAVINFTRLLLLHMTQCQRQQWVKSLTESRVHRTSRFQYRKMEHSMGPANPVTQSRNKNLCFLCGWHGWAWYAILQTRPKPLLQKVCCYLSVSVHKYNWHLRQIGKHVAIHKDQHFTQKKFCLHRNLYFFKKSYIFPFITMRGYKWEKQYFNKTHTHYW